MAASHPIARRFIHVSGFTLRTRRAVEMYEKMRAKSGGTDRGPAKDRGTDDILMVTALCAVPKK